ncbi:MAG: response regulator transcription factor [Xanthomonadales bacterium]|nr:response regulator transcription factor [Xanthomonadales bacterium]
MKLLLVEDSMRLRETIQRGLDRAGFTVDAVGDGAQAKAFLQTYEYELMVLDLMLPRIGGLAVLRSLGQHAARPRVLVLSARDQVSDRVQALDRGADDYLVKPFAFDELLARLHALARRPQVASAPLLEIGHLKIDSRAQQALIEGKTLPLTPREFALLALLARHRGRVFSRKQILEHTAGSDSQVSDRSVEVTVFSLRRKLSVFGLDGILATRRGTGYVIP